MKINGKEVSLRFGMLSVEIFLSEAEKLNGLSFYSAFGLAKIIHAGMVNYYDVKGLPHPVTFEEIYDFIEAGLLNDGELTEVKEAIKQFESSQALQKKTQQIEQANEELKKADWSDIRVTGYAAGLKPDEYYWVLPKDFVEFVEGYNKRLTDQHEIARRQAYFAMAPHMSKPITIGKFNKDYWPLPGDTDGEQDKKQRLIEKLKRLKANGNGTTSDRDTGESAKGPE